MIRDRDEPRRFFRGAEFSRLIILAAALAIGWPMAVYYGFIRANKDEPKKPAPAAALPPLPRPDAAPALAAIRDRKPPSTADLPAQALLAERVRATPPATLAAEARREVQPIDLLKRPERYRGLPIHLEGHAAEVFVVDDVDPEVTPRQRLYEVWGRTLDHDQRMYPVCMIVEAVPPTLPAGKDLSERVRFDGYFLKLVTYQAGDGVRFAPVLIGRMEHLVGQSPPAPRPRSRLWTVLPLALLAVYVAFRFLFARRKIRRQIAARTRPLVAGPDDRIEPEALDLWLRSGADEPGPPKAPEKGPTNLDWD